MLTLLALSALPCLPYSMSLCESHSNSTLSASARIRCSVSDAERSMLSDRGTVLGTECSELITPRSMACADADVLGARCPVVRGLPSLSARYTVLRPPGVLAARTARTVSARFLHPFPTLSDQRFAASHWVAGLSPSSLSTTLALRARAPQLIHTLDKTEKLEKGRENIIQRP